MVQLDVQLDEQFDAQVVIATVAASQGWELEPRVPDGVIGDPGTAYFWLSSRRDQRATHLLSIGRFVIAESDSTALAALCQKLIPAQENQTTRRIG